MRVASPCSVGWETMTGDERVRRCNSCELNIYNIAEMTKPEVENLVKTHEGRLCVRLFKRADGTVLTKDCPVGLRATYKRTAKFAGAALSAVFALVSVGFGQTKNKDSEHKPNVEIVRTENENQESILSGYITDPNGALIPNAKIKLYKKGKKKPQETTSDSDGNYIFSFLSKGVYRLEIEFQGFKKFKNENLTIGNDEKVRLNIVLEVSEESVVVGIFTSEPLIDMSSSEVKTVITREMMDRIPH